MRVRYRCHVVLAVSLACVACSSDRVPASGTSSAQTVAIAAGARPLRTATVVLGAGNLDEDGGGPVDTGDPVSPRGLELGGLDGGAPALRLGVRAGPVSVRGRLPPEVIERIVRQSFGRFRVCYAKAGNRDPPAQGRVQVGFVIDKDGRVSSATADRALTTLPDANVVKCVVRVFSALSFPSPEGGIVVVGYPLDFTPPLPAPAAPSAKP